MADDFLSGIGQFFSNIPSGIDQYLRLAVQPYGALRTVQDLFSGIGSAAGEALTPAQTYTDPNTGEQYDLGNTWRGFGADVFNATNVAGEDASRSLTSDYLAWQRSEDSALRQREWSSAEAEKAYQRQLDAERTYYSRLMESAKLAGLNPVLAIGGRGLDTSAGAVTAGSSAGTSSTSSFDVNA